MDDRGLEVWSNQRWHSNCDVAGFGLDDAVGSELGGISNHAVDPGQADRIEERRAG